LLETTGLANPGPVAAVLWVDDQLESPVRLDSIVTVVDARNIRQQLADTREAGSVNEAYLQIAFAVNTHAASKEADHHFSEQYEY
jgi:G3E family GTPase